MSKTNADIVARLARESSDRPAARRKGHPEVRAAIAAAMTPYRVGLALAAVQSAILVALLASWATGCGYSPGWTLYDDRDAGAGAGPGRRVASIHDCPALLDSGPAIAAFIDEAAPLAGVSLAFARDVAYWWEVRCVDDHTQDVHCADAHRCPSEGDPFECTTRPKPGTPSDTYISTDVPADEVEAYALHGLLHAILMAHDGDESHTSPAWALLGVR